MIEWAIRELATKLKCNIVAFTKYGEHQVMSA